MLVRRLIIFSIVLAACSGPESPPPDGSRPDASLPVADAGDVDAGGEGDHPDMVAFDANSTDVDAGAADAGADIPGPATLTFEEFCTEYLDAYVAYIDSCYPPSDTQLDAESISKRCLDVAQNAEPGEFDFDGELAATCVQNLRTTPCAGIDTTILFPECLDVVKGAQVTGETCHENSYWFKIPLNSCADGWCGRDTCPRTCHPWRQMGESCDDSAGSECAPNLYCDSNICVPLLEPNNSCVFSDRCVAEYACFNGFCQEAIPYGGPCSRSDDRCIGNSTCLGGSCRWNVETGDTCEARRNCPVGDACIDPDGEGTGVLGTCEPWSLAGEPCGGLFEQDCAPELDCIDNFCVPFGQAGEPCTQGKCVAGTWCRDVDVDADQCTPLGQLGDNCAHFDGSSWGPHGCVDGLTCVAGTCRAAGALGDPCEPFFIDSCQAGLFCSKVTRQCETPAGLDEPCNPGFPATCAAGLACDCGTNDSDCLSRLETQDPADLCKPALAAGDVCWRGSECESRWCRDHDRDGTSNCEPVTCPL